HRLFRRGRRRATHRDHHRSRTPVGRNPPHTSTYLALDTSATASAAVHREGETIAHRATDSHRNHSEVLAGFITEVLTDAGLDPTHPTGLDAMFVGVGPGPFTGLRAGIITAQTLAHTWNIPVYGVLSHDGLAHRVAGDAFRHGAGEFIEIRR